MCRITWSISGCISGSPPLMVITEVPIPARMSSRFFISASGTGLEKSSNSLQYVHARLQRRLGIMCTRIGCFVETSAFPIMRNSRSRVRRKRRRLRALTAALARTGLEPSAIYRKIVPLSQLYMSLLHRKHACPCVLLFVANQVLTLEMEQKPDAPAYAQFLRFQQRSRT